MKICDKRNFEVLVCKKLFQFIWERIFVVDLENPSAEVEITGQSTYSFSYNHQPVSEDMSVENRFVIRFVPKDITSIGQAVTGSIMAYAANEDVVVLSPTAIKTVKVYDASGKYVRFEEGNGNTSMKIKNVLRAKGVYVVYVTTEQGVKSVKVIR